MIRHRNRIASILSPATYSRHLAAVFPDSLAEITSLIRHPRSLARPLATWRPPGVPLPALPGQDPLHLTVSRHRVGTAARQVVPDAAYLITLRITSPDGYLVPANLAEGWVRALLRERDISSVHELSDEPAPTFCWLVDARFTPEPSPARLFEIGADHAA